MRTKFSNGGLTVKQAAFRSRPWELVGRETTVSAIQVTHNYSRKGTGKYMKILPV